MPLGKAAEGRCPFSFVSESETESLSPSRPTEPMRALLLATIPVTDNNLETLAADGAKAVRACILQTGRVEAARLFLTENQPGGVRSDGSRVYLQFR